MGKLRFPTVLARSCPHRGKWDRTPILPGGEISGPFSFGVRCDILKSITGSENTFFINMPNAVNVLGRDLERS